MEPGAGGFVFLIKHVETEERSVLKVSFVKEEKKKEFEKQIEFWKELCSKETHIVILENWFFDDTYGCIVMEFCGNGDLATLIKKKILENERFSEYVFIYLFFYACIYLS
jgi:serine/threonine protein kinase